MPNIENSSEDHPSEKSHNNIPDPSPKYEDAVPSAKLNNPKLTASDETKPKQENHQNHGLQDHPESPVGSISLSPNEERTWAMLAHLSVLLNLVTGFLGGITAIIIYFMYKDRSRLVAYHAMQAFIVQAIAWLGAGLLSGLFIAFGSVFAILVLPLLCLIPGFLLLLLIPISLIYGIIGGVQVNQGKEFRYWQVGDWVRDILDPEPVPQNKI
jgi:uncharacterized protein